MKAFVLAFSLLTKGYSLAFPYVMKLFLLALSIVTKLLFVTFCSTEPPNPKFLLVDTWHRGCFPVDWQGVAQSITDPCARENEVSKAGVSAKRERRVVRRKRGFPQRRTLQGRTTPWRVGESDRSGGRTSRGRNRRQWRGRAWRYVAQVRSSHGRWSANCDLRSRLAEVVGTCARVCKVWKIILRWEPV